jgi:hypothetical protein
VNCDCGTGVGGAGNPQKCINKNLVAEAAAVASPQKAKTVLQVIYEDSADPASQEAGKSNCLFGDIAGLNAGTDAEGGGAGNTGITPRGCKKRAALQYTPPLKQLIGAETKPGFLKLVQLDTEGVVTNTLATLNNVTRFGCGMSYDPSQPPAGVALNNDFLVRIEVKARQYNIDLEGQQNFESWDPNDPTFTFKYGVIRSHSGQISFRNFVIPGVQFGKLRTYRNCIPDGRKSNDPQQCCSGYADNAGKCLDGANSAAPACGWDRPTVKGMAVTSACCSRMADPDNAGACL